MKRLLKPTVAVVLMVSLLIPGGMALAIPSMIPVDVDIKPESCPNPLNVGSTGVLPVAILGSEEFDVTEVEPGSIVVETGVVPLRWALEDVAGPGCSGPDGYLDLNLKFKTQEIVLVLGPVSDGEVRPLQLGGEMLDGTLIFGEDQVRIIKKE
jgi:hypothetical protein